LGAYLLQQVPTEFTISTDTIALERQDGRRVRKTPDTGLKPSPDLVHNDTDPRLIVEVSVSRHTLPVAQTEYRAYFDGIPAVRAVLLIKLRGYRDDGAAAAAAVLYRRNEQDNVIVADLVSFGTVDLQHIAKTALDRIDATLSSRDLSGGPNGDLNAPAEIVIPATDLHHGTTLVDGNGALLQPRPDLGINLRIVFDQFLLCERRARLVRQ
jgi:hypothetical protein